MRVKNILQLFGTDNTRRSKLLQKNIILSFGLTGVNMLISYVMYPLLIDYLGVEKYGVWLTISSLSTWMTFFEFGLGSGLKNQLAQTLAHRHMERGKVLVSTTYFAVFVIVAILFAVLFSTQNFVDWNDVLGIESVESAVLQRFVSIMLGSIFIVFLLKLIGNVASATQNPYIEKLITASMNVVLLMVVYYFIQFVARGDLNKLGLVWSSVTIFVWMFFSGVLYFTKFKEIRPSVKHIRISNLKKLGGLGIKFFIIQISLVIIHGSTNFMIAKYIGSGEVVTYNAVYKLFSIANIIYSIIIAPTWVAFVDAIENNDYVWVKSTVRRMLKIWAILMMVMLIILVFSPWIYNIWLGDRIQVPFTLSLLLFLYFITMTFGGVFNMFVNATGRVNRQLWSWVITAVLYLFATIWLLKNTDLGVYAVAIGLLLSNAYYVVIAPKEYFNLVKSYEIKN